MGIAAREEQWQSPQAAGRESQAAMVLWKKEAMSTFADLPKFPCGSRTSIFMFNEDDPLSLPTAPKLGYEALEKHEVIKLGKKHGSTARTS